MCQSIEVSDFNEKLFSQELQNKIWYRALSLTQDEHDAKDLLQDTFVKAFLAAEDSDYFNHTGVDLFSLIRAAYQFLREGEIVSGGGTITMQVARNYVLTKERTFERKLKEIFTALKIDFSFSKEEIFELYVNQIFLGNRAYGIKAAAEIYYDRKLEDLTLSQFAMIAALPKSPSKINPLANPRNCLLYTSPSPRDS
mgnify:CR=1 FL=1